MTRRTALIVDDSSTARILLSRVLNKIDVDSRTAGSAEEGLDVLKTYKPDLIFLDHILPGMNGFTALKALKANPDTASIPVVMYTSQNAPRYIEEARELGAAGIIGKQLDREKLHQIVDQVCAYAPAEELATLELASAHLAESLEDDPGRYKRIGGRLSTLETAYEELHDEFRQTRQEFALYRSRVDEQIAQQAQSSRTRMLILCALMVVFGGMIWSEMGTLSDIVTDSNAKFAILHDLITDLVSLIEK